MSSEEVNDAEGSAPSARVDAIDLLTAKRAALTLALEKYQIAKKMRDEIALGELSRQIDALRLEIIPALETEVAVVLEATGKKEAEDRLLAIKRAYGSTVASYQQDEARVATATASLRD